MVSGFQGRYDPDHFLQKFTCLDVLFRILFSGIEIPDELVYQANGLHHCRDAVRPGINQAAHTDLDLHQMSRINNPVPRLYQRFHLFMDASLV
jgi:hypothetical protein